VAIRGSGRRNSPVVVLRAILARRLETHVRTPEGGSDDAGGGDVDGAGGSE
jgi:hypothetical protein